MPACREDSRKWGQGDTAPWAAPKGPTAAQSREMGLQLRGYHLSSREQNQNPSQNGEWGVTVPPFQGSPTQPQRRASQTWVFPGQVRERAVLPTRAAALSPWADPLVTSATPRRRSDPPPPGEGLGCCGLTTVSRPSQEHRGLTT